MQYFYTPKFDGSFTMSWVGESAYPDEISTQNHDIITLVIQPKKSITSITKFTDIVKGETNEHYFKKFFSYSNMRSGVTYSDPAPITGITGEYCPLNDLYLNLTYYRIDTTNGLPTLRINAIVIEGTYDIEVTDEIIEVPDNGYILEPKNIYKIFKLTGYEIYGINTNNLIIKYRFTQDGGRTYTPWEPLSTENISTIKLNPIRFAQVQYSITKIDNLIVSKIYDVILTGDFQNINNYYLKTNRYGVREDCNAGGLITTGSTTNNSNGSNTNICITNNRGTYMGQNPNGSSYNYNRDWITQGLSCYLTGNVITSMTTDSANTDGILTNTSTGTFNPYSTSNQTKISSWYNYLANTVGNIFGWTIDYHLTDPDGKGIDRVLHEYQLFNIVDMQKLKIIVPENNFPDNQVQINEYMLDMMDTFKVLILKDEFQRVFGIEKRPSQKDIIYFCQANRAYRVRHAQVHREIMYQGIYYDIILEKYEQLANEQNLSNASKNVLDPLTRNNTLDSLFGEEVKSQQNKVVNKQLKPTTHDAYKANINKKLDIVTRDIFNGLKGTKIADNYYNLSSLPNGSEAVTYTKQDPTLYVSDNRAITFWFSFNTKYDPNKAINDTIFKSYDVPNNKKYSFISNYNPDDQLGYKIEYSNKQFVLFFNELRYVLDVPDIKTNIWYGLAINIDNRQRVISMDLFKRNYNYSITMYTDKYEKVVITSDNTTGLTYYTSRGYRPVNNKEINETLSDTKLLLVKSFTGTTEAASFQINETITLYSSDVKLTNIRFFNNIIPKESISDILQQRVIQDSQYLILADNANRQLYTDNILNTRWE